MVVTETAVTTTGDMTVEMIDAKTAEIETTTAGITVIKMAFAFGEKYLNKKASSSTFTETIIIFTSCTFKRC